MNKLQPDFIQIAKDNIKRRCEMLKENIKCAKHADENIAFIPKESDNIRGMSKYAFFIDNLVCVDIAMKNNRWEEADDYTSMLADNSWYKNDLHCAKLMMQIFGGVYE